MELFQTRIINTVCPKCRSRFFSTAPMSKSHCPQCNSIAEECPAPGNGRSRIGFANDCYIVAGGLGMHVKAENISEKGLGIKIMGEVPFQRGDLVHVAVKDFEIESDARVIWMSGPNGIITRAGLTFC